jgi:hypothetical protein
MNLCFVKTTKTAGTSVEVALQYALFGVEPSHDQEWQIYREGFCTPRGDFRSTKLLRNVSMVPLAIRHGLDPFRTLTLRNHSAPTKIMYAITTKRFESLTKVVPVRNPYDLVVSSYFYTFRDKPNPPPFPIWVQSKKRSKVNDEIVPHFNSSWKVIRFETLEEDVRLTLDSLGLSLRSSIPSLKSGYRPAHARNYRHLYDSSSRAAVESLFSDWFQAFSYEW